MTRWLIDLRQIARGDVPDPSGHWTEADDIKQRECLGFEPLHSYTRPLCHGPGRNQGSSSRRPHYQYRCRQHFPCKTIATSPLGLRHQILVTPLGGGPRSSVSGDERPCRVPITTSTRKAHVLGTTTYKDHQVHTGYLGIPVPADCSPGTSKFGGAEPPTRLLFDRTTMVTQMMETRLGASSTIGW
ncbi:hypothetical protein VTK56DRAFT_10176 [Thermocarpiscus australiensis]